ncbi:MAG: DUF5368 domain-containing protein [Pseudomonadota bacterium]
MEGITMTTVVAVLQEMLGAAVFWALCIGVLVVTISYLYVLMRDRAVSWRKFLLAQISMPFGAVVAVWFIQWATSSSLSDVGGPIDVIVLLIVSIAGAIGIAILVYTLQALVRPVKETHPQI